MWLLSEVTEPLIPRAILKIAAQCCDKPILNIRTDKAPRRVCPSGTLRKYPPIDER